MADFDAEEFSNFWVKLDLIEPTFEVTDGETLKLLPFEHFLDGGNFWEVGAGVALVPAFVELSWLNYQSSSLFLGLYSR